MAVRPARVPPSCAALLLVLLSAALPACGDDPIDCDDLTPADAGAPCTFGGELCEVEACETEEGLDFDFECVSETWEKIDDSCQ